MDIDVGISLQDVCYRVGERGDAKIGQACVTRWEIGRGERAGHNASARAVAAEGGVVARQGDGQGIMGGITEQPQHNRFILRGRTKVYVGHERGGAGFADAEGIKNRGLVMRKREARLAVGAGEQAFYGQDDVVAERSVYYPFRCASRRIERASTFAANKVVASMRVPTETIFCMMFLH